MLYYIGYIIFIDLRYLKMLERKESKAIVKGIEEYGAAAEVINKTLEESETLPTFDEIINNIETKEQLESDTESILQTAGKNTCQK